MKIRLDKFLKKIGILDYEITEPNRWIVTIPIHTEIVESFAIDIYQTDGWISFTSVVMENLSGKNLPHFYELLFRLNHFLNGLKFSVDFNGEYITLQTETDSTEFDIDRLKNVLQQFIMFYTNWYPALINIASEYDLTYRKPTKKQSIVDKMLNSIVTSEILNQFINPALPSEVDDQQSIDVSREKKK
jgi:hypothetical protein